MSNISINNAIPENALERQLYFIEKCKEHVAQLKKELNRPLLCCTQTFGCQMNARDSEKLLGILEEIDILQQIQKRPILLYTIHVQYVKMQIYVYMEDSAS